MEHRLSDRLRPQGATRLGGADRQRDGQDREEQDRARPCLGAEVAEQTPRAGEDDRGEQEVLDRASAGAAGQPELEVRDRPEQDGQDRHEQHAHATGDQATEDGRRDAGDRRHGVPRESRIGSSRTDDVRGRQSAERQLRRDRDGQHDGFNGEPPNGGNDCLEHRDEHGGGAVDAPQDGEAAPIAEDPADHPSSSRSSSADRVASSCSGSSHARRATSTA